MATNGHTPDFRECDEFFDLRTVEHEASHVVPYIKPNSRIIDVGCGIGAITLDFARRVPEGYVLGVDYSAGECRSRPCYKRKSKIHTSFISPTHYLVTNTPSHIMQTPSASPKNERKQQASPTSNSCTAMRPIWMLRSPRTPSTSPTRIKCSSICPETIPSKR